MTGDATYTAKYDSTVNEYTVKFVDEDGTELQSSKVAYGETPVYSGETPVKAATAQYTYTFAGWTTEIVSVTDEATYTATYTETVNKYTVTWIVDGNVTTAEAEYGILPTFTGSTDKAADADYTYTFKGWDKEVVAVTGDVTYTAIYDQEKIEKVIPLWNTRRDVVTHRAYDGLFNGNSKLADGASLNWSEASTAVLTAGGWVGVKGELGQFGYRIDGGELFYDDAWMNEQTSGGVYDAGMGTGADKVARFSIAVPYTRLDAGEHTIDILYKSTDGVELILISAKINIVIPQWTSRKDVVTHRAFDGLFNGNTKLTDGATLNWSDATSAELRAGGWAGVKGELGQFGYRIDGGDRIYVASWTTEQTSGAVYDAGMGTGADKVARYNVMVSYAGLSVGDHTIEILYKSADGVEVILLATTIKIEIPLWNTRRDVVVHRASNGNSLNNVKVEENATISSSDASSYLLLMKGWAGMKGVLGQYGYRIDGGDRIYDDAWMNETTSGGTYNAGIGQGADKVAYFEVCIPLKGLSAGNHTIDVLYKSPNGIELIILSLTINISE